MKISRFINNPDKPFHSSGYAQIANGDSIGSTSGQSFGERSFMEKNRQTVQRYGDSRIARGHEVGRTRLNVIAPARSSRFGAPPRMQNNSAPGTVAPPARSSFIEPPARGYNPYK